MTFGKIVALAGVAMLVISTAQASGKLAFVTDRTAGDDDIWKARLDGTYQEEVTDNASDERNPSIAHTGDHWLYDRQGDLYITEADGTNQTNMTAGSTGACSGTALCTNPDAGKRVNVDNDFRVVFERTYTDTAQAGNPTITEIWMGTVDISAGTLGSTVQLTDITAAELAQLNPAWCGADHVVWDRSSPDESFYEREICVLEVDSSGPVGSPVCFFGDDSDNLDDRYPSCNPAADKIVWSRGTQYGNGDIYVMDCVDSDDDGDQFDDCDVSGVTNLSSDLHDDIQPVFDLGGTYIFWATDRGTGDDYEIFRMEDDGQSPTQMTDNSDEDRDPDVGPETSE